jgi:D-alanyl-D-alanine carboxypeptidase/D-alanyl-D-alanine-endopeptidase (penicillin-binding protein 4)
VSGLVTTLAAAGVVGVSSSSAVASAGTAQQLQTAITQALQGSTAAHPDWRFDVSGLGSLRHFAGSQSAPASNNKLFVAQTALQQLGSSYQFQTRALTTGTLVGHVLDGALVVKGSGDPSLDDADLAVLARQIRQAGISSVTGGLIVEDGHFRHRTTAPGWKPGFTPEETGPVCGFALDENEWKTSASYVAHPALANGNRFRGTLRRQGVFVHGTTTVGRASGPQPLTSIDSQPLSDIVAQMLTDSDNFVAEMLLDELGAQVGGAGTRTAGIAVIHREATSLRSPIGVIDDGSGLSYDDRESPDTIIDWLDAAARSSTGSELRSDLPVSCETGTLADRLCGHATKGKVQAKTGTLDGVRALSGYTTTKSGRTVTFSILLSGIRNMTAAERRMDAAVATVVRWDR